MEMMLAAHDKSIANLEQADAVQEEKISHMATREQVIGIMEELRLTRLILIGLAGSILADLVIHILH